MPLTIGTPLQFSDIFIKLWKTDVNTATPSAPPVSSVFSSTNFTNVAVKTVPKFLRDVTRLKLSTGTNQTLLSNWQIAANNRLQNFDGTVIGTEIPVLSSMTAQYNVALPDWDMKLFRDENDPKSFWGVDQSNDWRRVTYDFTSNTFNTITAEITGSFSWDWEYDYLNFNSNNKFDTDTNELGLGETSIRINDISASSGDVNFYLNSLSEAQAYRIIITEIGGSGFQFTYNVTSWTDNGTYWTFGVTLDSATGSYNPPPTFQQFTIEFLYTAQNNSSNVSFEAACMDWAGNLYVASGYPQIVSQVNSSGTVSVLGWWDLNTTTIMNQATKWDQNSLALLPAEGHASYPGWTDDYLVGCFQDGANYNYQIMDATSGLVVQSNFTGSRYVKVVPFCKTSSDNIFLVGYGEVAGGNEGVNFYEINSAGAHVTTYNYSLGAGITVLQVEFVGNQYMQSSPNSQEVKMLVATTNGEYSVVFDPSIPGFISNTQVSTRHVGAIVDDITIKCVPWNDLQGMFLYTRGNGVTNYAWWVNCGFQGWSFPNGDVLESFYPVNIMNDIDRRAYRSSTSKNFVADEGDGWYISSQDAAAGTRGGIHYIPANTGKKLSAYKEDLYQPIQNLGGNNHNHPVLYLYDPVNSKGGVIYGDSVSNTGYWSIAEEQPLTV